MLPDMAFLLSGWLRTRCAIPDSFICRSTPPPLYWPRRADTSSREGRGALWYSLWWQRGRRSISG